MLAATRRALEKGDAADRAELEELVGKTWLEKDLRRVADLRLLELAYETEALVQRLPGGDQLPADLGDGDALHGEADHAAAG